MQFLPILTPLNIVQRGSIIVFSPISDQPNNAAGNEPTNTKAALNTMTNQWQFFPSQNTASTNTTSTANPTSQAQTALSNATSTASANASPQASNGLSEVAQEFEKAINSIFGSISNFVKNL